MNPKQALSRGKLDDFINASEDLWFIKLFSWLFYPKVKHYVEQSECDHKTR